MSEHVHGSPSDEGRQAGADRPGRRRPALGPALRRAWIGYQRRLDQEMAAAGFPDGGFPVGGVVGLCAGFY
jgi:hypothetical protein